MTSWVVLLVLDMAGFVQYDKLLASQTSQKGLGAFSVVLECGT